MERYGEGISYFEKLFSLATTPDLIAQFIPMYIHLSYCHSKLGEHSEALFYANKRIDLTPLFPDGYVRRASVYFDMGNHAKALADCDEIIRLSELDPNLEMADRWKATAEKLRGEITAGKQEGAK
jgi:tetratricopeptide (TPR) repeat protein